MKFPTRYTNFHENRINIEGVISVLVKGREKSEKSEKKSEKRREKSEKSEKKTEKSEENTIFLFLSETSKKVIFTPK